VRVEARAKLNLGLAVGPRRPDGFHDLVTVFQSISLADHLTLMPRRQGFSIEVRHEDASVGGRPRSGRGGAGVPAGPANLALRAAQLLRDRIGLPGGAHLRLVKRIPTRAGLGGGSADAGGTLVGLARLYGLRLPRSRRIELAAELGSDVPFQTTGGTALGLGRGERLVPLRLERPFRALVTVPPWRVSTALAYRRIDRGKYALTGWGAKLRFGQRLEPDAVRPDFARRLGNTFESALGDRRAAFQSLRERLQRIGLESPQMSGSGSAVFGILRHGESMTTLMDRFQGTEALFAVRSTRRAIRVLCEW
jgi:4-diphosphocytidyl-2-C-methyl-D-erythritol kinase